MKDTITFELVMRAGANIETVTHMISELLDNYRDIIISIERTDLLKDYPDRE